ncbi:hypothetical protein CH373_16630 [Leptospira perolatii]|uniref:Uncharacterized protein n=1 Tax=Leptospira perolatii TaxID=2023191 RepID=A0A2M9ZIT7_9LEPT|nr:hypothetical protein CH360_15175 [Leptospira perolatii]PJZ71968.1 hypothetical protein CH373_16630 [Leptospira perolatii]
MTKKMIYAMESASLCHRTGPRPKPGWGLLPWEFRPYKRKKPAFDFAKSGLCTENSEEKLKLIW